MMNFEKYLPYFTECHEVISNTTVFASAIEDFYFNGNVMLGLMNNITEVSSRMNTWVMFDNKIIFLDVEWCYNMADNSSCTISVKSRKRQHLLFLLRVRRHIFEHLRFRRPRCLWYVICTLLKNLKTFPCTQLEIYVKFNTVHISQTVQIFVLI